MAELHTIKAYLYDNALTDNPNDFIARVIAESSLGVADICKTAVKRGGADISAAAMEHAVNIWFKEMAYRLCDGFAVNVGWFNAAACIKGTFNSPQEPFNPEKHTVLFELHQGSLLRKEIDNVTVQIVGVAEASISIAQVVDVKTGSVNDIITPGRNLRIMGHKVKIAGDDPEIGVYFTNQETQTKTKVDPSDVVVNHPSEILVIIPDGLTPGTYKLELKTRYSGNPKQPLKETRIALFDRVLTVA